MPNASRPKHCQGETVLVLVLVLDAGQPPALQVQPRPIWVRRNSLKMARDYHASMAVSLLHSIIHFLYLGVFLVYLG
jgi:hypothetical protein